MSFSPLPASQAKNISLRVVLPASYIMYQDINHVATRHQSLQPVAFPGGAVLNKKLALSLGEKKKTLNELKIFRLASISSPASVHPEKSGSANWGPCLFRIPKIGDSFRTPPNFGPKEKIGLPEVEGQLEDDRSFRGLLVEVAGFQLEKKKSFFLFFFWLEMSKTKSGNYPKKNRNSLPDILLMDKILHHLGWLKPYK